MSREDHESKRMEPGWNGVAGIRATWMGKTERSNGREHMSQCGQRTSFNRTRVAGHLDEIQGVVANTLNGARGNGAAGMRATWMGRPERVRLLG
jgi:hypothetical protein